ncbi:glycosyltransferase [uncultured Ilyobacter sp.]|uniref:glycosyltransferase n=1 Tax=uncultured Ilyobacter sp. TaxID=544433 RepID=UPI002AA903DE|nr:glycosyltransferase [uncultured Ilyobacter sp.]
MKIIQVVECFGGGVYSFLTDLCNELVIGNEIIIVYSQREETPKNFKNDFDPSIRFIKLDLSLINWINASLKLAKIIKKEKPAVIHLHSSKAGFIGRIAKFISNYRGKLFYNPHGLSFLRLDLSEKIRKILFLAEYFLAKFGGIVIAVSTSELNEIKKISTNSILINNGVNIDELEKELKNINIEKTGTNQIIVGTVGRIVFQKNPKLFNEIAKEFPDFKFIWVGDGDLKSELIENNIKITGWLSRKNTLIEMSNFDIYIQTSLWEGLPISILEALYLKKPIIVNNAIGNIDTVQKNGFICNSKTDFLKALYFLKNKDVRESLGKKSFEYLNLNFNAKDTLKKYKKLYGSM